MERRSSRCRVLGARCSVLGARYWKLVQSKRGRRPPPFSAGEVAYRFLPPFFFPPLAVFFAIALNPPLHSWDPTARSCHRDRRTAASWHASLPIRGARRFFANSRESGRERSAAKK